MIASRRRRIVKLVLWVVAPVGLLAILQPWTVRPLEGNKPTVFDAESFAMSAWPRIVREATQTAIEISESVTPAGASPAHPRFVRGTGVVAAVDRGSRVGVLRVKLSGSGPSAVAIQVGPVVRGTALRDASSFIHFSDFTNQFDYAGAANALNDHALRTVVAPLAIDALPGRTIRFAGAVGKSAPREDGAVEIVPVQLEVVEAAAK